MKRFSSFSMLVVAAMLFVGCEFHTDPPERKPIPTASTLVINEVFTLPPNYPSTYSWIEFLNPTPNPVNVANWTLTFATYRNRDSIYQRVLIDTMGNFLALFEFSRTSRPVGYGVYDVPFMGGGLFLPGFGGGNFILPSGGLLTIVSNEDRLLDHTRWGPGDSRYRFSLDSIFVVDSLSILSVVRDTLGQDTVALNVIVSVFKFALNQKDQLILKDSAGTIVDVVRIGDTTFTNVVGDTAYSSPLLGSSNRTVGSVPLFESVARYRGGHSTGNTADDFYITRPGIRPTPHYYNTLGK